MKRVLAAILLAVISMSSLMASTAARPNREAKIAIFIGPQARGGFVDVDSGVLDSIKDVQNAFHRASKFKVVPTTDKADILLFVVGRRIAGQSSSVGLPLGPMTMFLPVKRLAIDTVLRVGAYEKALTSAAEDNDHWRASAQVVVKDVTAWVDANRSALLTK